MTTRRQEPGLKSDAALAALGCCLALGSATFGLVMTVHGPLAGFGKGSGFTVFAQLAPRTDHAAQPASTGDSTDLDLTATASIPHRDPAPAARAETPVVTLQAASAGAATIAIDGQPTVVHVGDEIPGLGAVLAIVPGAHPEIRTTNGVILAER